MRRIFEGNLTYPPATGRCGKNGGETEKQNEYK